VATIDVKKVFGTSVRGWRNLLGISQEELAERANLHRTYVSDIERGARNLSLESIERLAHALEISVSSLFPQPEMKNGRTITANGNGKGLVDILLVEDNPDDVELTLLAFKKSRFTNRVHVVSDGAEALDYLFSKGKYAARRTIERPHVVLLDLKLPKVNGIEVLRRIKADKRTSMIPVVILTISDDNYDIAECRRLGADNYIVKPVDFQRLSQATPQLNLNWALLKPLKPNGRNVRA
jgi:CheY-like chemotaxis protein/DNA-binding XRE family transcriptional regulator